MRRRAARERRAVIGADLAIPRAISTLKNRHHWAGLADRGAELLRDPTEVFVGKVEPAHVILRIAIVAVGAIKSG